MNKFLKFFLPLTLVVAASSCSELKDVIYFQDSQNGKETPVATSRAVTIQPSDQLSIIVTSKDPELASVFNLPVITHQTGSAQPGFEGTSSTNQVASYYVDANGNIDFPIIGVIHVGGLTRDQIAVKIKAKIIESNYINDPVVAVEFCNMYVSVFGDVSRPGRVKIDKDRMTVLDVLSKSGDLNVTGIRSVKLFREENGVQKCYVLDLTSSESLFASPVYYVKQEDILYVIPNKMKARTSTVNGNTLLSASFWLSCGSLAISIASLIVNIQVVKK